MTPRKKPLSKSEQMSRVKSRDTAPEMLVRQFLSKCGVRYRLHRKDLPGRPDLYIPRLHLALFVNGCFWHGHGCRRAARSKTNVDFWTQKIARNKARDRATGEALRAMDIETLTLWTCELDAFPKACRDIMRRYERES